MNKNWLRKEKTILKAAFLWLIIIYSNKTTGRFKKFHAISDEIALEKVYIIILDFRINLFDEHLWPD